MENVEDSRPERPAYTPEEIRQHREEWLKALESGEYPQGMGTLVRETPTGKAYCCMGVACMVARKGGVPLVELPIQLGNEPGRNIFTYDGVDGVMPRKVYEWLGFSVANPSVDGKSLAEWNDGSYSHGSITFEGIAAKLRRFWNMPKPETTEQDS